MHCNSQKERAENAGPENAGRLLLYATFKVVQALYLHRYAGQSISVADTTISIIQGSGLGPASYIITAADLHPVTDGNRIVKFADDTYLVVPAFNSTSRLHEINHIQTWAAENNLMLNCS